MEGNVWHLDLLPCYRSQGLFEVPNRNWQRPFCTFVWMNDIPSLCGKGVRLSFSNQTEKQRCLWMFGFGICVCRHFNANAGSKVRKPGCCWQGWTEKHLRFGLGFVEILLFVNTLCSRIQWCKRNRNSAQPSSKHYSRDLAFISILALVHQHSRQFELWARVTS